jgi:hypothetical protein
MLSLQAFGKVVPIRFKRLENQGRTAQRNSTIDHESDSSVPTNISHPVSTSSQPGFEEPATGFPSTVYPWGASPTHQVSDIAQVALPLVQAFTGVIPLVGAPMSAAIGGLLQIL